MESLRMMGQRWKLYEREGKWKYEGEQKPSASHDRVEIYNRSSPFLVHGLYLRETIAAKSSRACIDTIQWDLHSEAPDLFQHLSESKLVIFKGDLNHRE